MWCFSLLIEKIQLFDFSAMLDACGHNIDPGRFDVAVAEDVCQLGDILFDLVKGPGKKLAQIVGKYFGRGNLRRFAQPLHLRPDAAAVKGIAVS